MIKDRFVHTPRVLLMEEATRYLVEESWREYSEYLATSLQARSTTAGPSIEGDIDSGSLDIGLAGAEVLLAIWDDKTLVLKVDLQYRVSQDEDREGNGFIAGEVPCIEQHPFITIGTLREDVDREQAGEDLLWRWMNPPPPTNEPQPGGEETVEFVHIHDDVYIPKRKEEQSGKVFCTLLDIPVLLPGVIRPILASSS